MLPLKLPLMLSLKDATTRNANATAKWDFVTDAGVLKEGPHKTRLLFGGGGVITCCVERHF